MTDQTDGPAPKTNQDAQAGHPERVIPWIQGLCVVAMVAVFFIDTQSADDSPPVWLYLAIGGVAVGLDPKSVVEIASTIFRRD